MTIKRRFKKALFAFFEKEIMKSVGYTGDVQRIEHFTSHLKFTEIKAEIRLDNRGEQLSYGESLSVTYERALNDCKRRLFEESMKHIHIEEKSIMDSHIYNGRAIRISLFVGQHPKQL